MKRKDILISAIISLVVFTLVLQGNLYAQTNGLEVKIYKIRHASAQSLFEVANNLKSNEGKISIDTNSNSIIVMDDPLAQKRIREVIESLDIAVQQVEISVVVADVTGTFLNTIGLSSGRLIIPAHQFSVTLQALSKSKSSQIRSQMTITTLSNSPASLQVASDELFGRSVVRYSDGTEVVTNLRRPVGDFLEVLPRVNNDGTLTIAISPQVSTRETGGAAPFERSVLTQAVINDGDTIAIAGLESSIGPGEERSTFLGIPMAKRKLAERRRVAMFLTARVLDAKR